MSTKPTVPANLVGPLRDVRQDVAARVRRFVAGEPWQPFAATAAHPVGLLVLSPMPILNDDVHTRVYLPLALLADEIVAYRLAPEREDDAVQASLTTAAGVLGLLAPVNQILIHPPARHVPLVDAATRFWPEFVDFGPIFTIGSNVGAPLWELSTSLQYVLAKLGVAHEALRTPLPPGGLAELVQLL